MRLKERRADKEVIASLLREISRMKGTKVTMHIKLFKDSDGQIKNAIQTEVVSRDDIVTAIFDNEKEHNDLTNALADFDALNDNAPANDPVEAEVVAPPAEPQPEQPVPPTEIPAPAPEQPLTDTTVAPAPVADPVPAPEQPAPAPEQPVPTPAPVTIA